MFGKKQKHRRKARKKYARINELERKTKKCDSLIEAVKKYNYSVFLRYCEIYFSTMTGVEIKKNDIKGGDYGLLHPIFKL